MESLCLVFDMDETILHYSEQSEDDEEDNILNNEDPENEFTNIINTGDRLSFRPGFWDFLQYVREQEGRILVGMWTYGNKPYATAVRPYFDKDEMFEFVYTLEDQRPQRENKELTYVVKNIDNDIRERLGIEGNTRLPKNIFLVDNRPENIYHEVNRKNGILVESFMGYAGSDTMFENLKKICDSLLSRGRIPSNYLQIFKIENKKMVLASIGSKFDDGLRPIMLSKRSSRAKGSKSRRRRRTGGNKGSDRKTKKKIMA